MKTDRRCHRHLENKELGKAFGSLHSVARLAREELAELSSGGFASVNATSASLLTPERRNAFGHQ
jgi:hypothetical protein